MPRTETLTTADFKKIRPRHRLSGAYFSLAVAPAPRPGVHIASVVSRKVSAHAVTRNRIKRRLRSTLTQARPLPALALIFTAKRSAAEATYAEIQKDVHDLLNKVHSLPIK